MFVTIPLNNNNKYSNIGTSTNPVDVIRDTDASLFMVRDLGLVQKLGGAYWMDVHCSFLKKV